MKNLQNLQKLHPRAIWLFFVSYIWKVIFLLILVIAFYSPTLYIKSIASRPFSRQEPNFWFGALSVYLGEIILTFLILLIMSYFWARLSYHFYRYQLTNNAVKIERGVIWKKYVSIPYERVQNVDIYRGLIARILGLSDIHIQTAGLSTGGKGHFITEGRLPGLDPKVAEDLREELIKKVEGKKQGL